MRPQTQNGQQKINLKEKNGIESIDFEFLDHFLKKNVQKNLLNY